MKKGIDTWFNELRVGDVVETAYGKEVIRKKYDDMLGFDANGRTNLNADGLYPIAISGCRPIDNTEYIRKDALVEFVNKKLQESADRLDFNTNRAYAEVIDHINEM